MSQGCSKVDSSAIVPPPRPSPARRQVARLEPSSLAGEGSGWGSRRTSSDLGVIRNQEHTGPGDGHRGWYDGGDRFVSHWTGCVPSRCRLGAGNADIPPHRPEVRHRDPADPRDAAGDGRGGGRRRRHERGPDRPAAPGEDGRAAGQGGRPVRPVGDDGQPDRHRPPRQAGRRADLRPDGPRLPLGRGRDRPALGRDAADDRAGRRAARPGRPPGQGPARRLALRPDPADLPGEHPQPGGRQGPPDHRRSPRSPAGPGPTAWRCTSTAPG